MTTTTTTTSAIAPTTAQTTAQTFAEERYAYWTALAEENRALGYPDLEDRCRQFAASWAWAFGGAPCSA